MQNRFLKRSVGNYSAFVSRPFLALEDGRFSSVASLPRQTQLLYCFIVLVLRDCAFTLLACRPFDL